MEQTLSVIKADIGGYVGHSCSHPDVVQKAKERLEQARNRGLLTDYRVTVCGDDLQLIMSHQRGQDNEQVHKLAWDTFVECTAVAKGLKLHGAGQDLLADAFSGNVRGMGPGIAEMQFVEREAETIIVLMADKTASGAWNLPLYKIFADPFNTIGLVIASNMHSGFRFEVHDVKGSKKITFNAPEEIYDMLVFLGAPGRYAVKAIYHGRAVRSRRCLPPRGCR
jgi:fructose 1,6-bisphosphate aldolase/phosphatase